MNDILAAIYENFFNWDLNQELLGIVFDNSDYEKIAWGFLIIPVTLFIFYKVWDPIPLPKIKWWISLILISIICYSWTSYILYSDFDIREYIGNYSEEQNDVQPDYFVFKMGMISALIAFIISGILSIFPFRLLSSGNRHNPF